MPIADELFNISPLSVEHVLRTICCFLQNFADFYKKCVDDIDEHKFNSKDVRKHV